MEVRPWREVDSWENPGDLATPSSLCSRISCMEVRPWREVDSWENTGDLATPSSLCNTKIS
jgi:hypothetical protein